MWIANVAPRLHQLGHEIIVFTSKYGQQNNMEITSKMLRSGIKIHEFENHTMPFKVPTISSFKKILKILKDTNVEVLYFNNAFALNEVLVYLLKAKRKIKVVSGHHGTFPEAGNIGRRFYHRVVNRNINRIYDANHVLNQEREVILKRWGYKNVYRIPYGIDTSELRPGTKDNIFTVMFAGGMLYQKGIDRFSSLVELLDSTKSNTDIKFLIFGSGPLSHIAGNLSKKFKNVEYTGYAYPEQLAKAYRKSHVFVFPSRFEEGPLVVREALASGTPVIASNILGAREMVKNGITGFVVDSSTVEELAKPILMLKDLWYNRPEEYEKYCFNARESMSGGDWSKVVHEIEQMLKEVVTQRPTSWRS
jgi:glycosyltransferase involved in cell wall biosynthesis